MSPDAGADAVNVLHSAPAESAPPPSRDANSASGKLDEAELVRRILNGEPTASEQFFRHYRGHVTGVLRRMMGADSEVSDLVQETFLRALRRIENIRTPNALRSWVTRVATYTALDHLRRRRRRDWLEFVPPEHLQRKSEDDVNVVMTRVQEIMGTLSTEEQLALTLRFIRGLEQKELAEAMQCSVATAKRRVNRARQRFEALASRDEILRARM